MFRLSPGSLPFLDRDASAPDWINWPVLLSAAERAWHLVEDLSAVELETEGVEAKIALVMEPILERLSRARWMPVIVARASTERVAQLHKFQSGLITVLDASHGYSHHLA